MNDTNLRQCPVCGGHEPAGSFLCSSCGADLSSVRPTRPAAERPSGTSPKRSEPVAQAPSTSDSKACPRCQATNAAWALLCVQCGADLPAVSQLPAAGGASSVTAGNELFLVIHGRTYRCNPGDVLGRDGTIAREEFQACPTVHRKHARVSLEDGQWRLTADAHAKNITAIDDQKLKPGEGGSLSADHHVRFSTKLTFLLKVVRAA
jgi:hypothetical protein